MVRVEKVRALMEAATKWMWDNTVDQAFYRMTEPVILIENGRFDKQPKNQNEDTVEKRR